MKKLLLTLGITSFVLFGANGAFAGECGSCHKPKSECGCQNKIDECDKTEKCESCHEMAEKCLFKDCYEKKREELYCRLNLDKCQRQEAKKIADAYRSDLDSAKDNMKDSHKCLCEKIKAPCLDKKAVRAQAKQFKNDMKEVKRVFKCMDKEFKTILHCDQKKEYRKIKREMNYRIKQGAKYCCKPCKCNK